MSMAWSRLWLERSPYQNITDASSKLIAAELMLRWAQPCFEDEPPFEMTRLLITEIIRSGS